MIWDADWSSESNEPAPLSLWHVIQSLCSIEKRFNWEDGPFHGPSTPLKVNGANFSTLLPPRVQLLPHFEVWSYRACQPLQMWQISHFCEIHSLRATRRQIFFAMLSQWGKFGTLLPPRGCNFYPILRYGLTEPASLLKCGKFHISVKSTSELRGVKVFLNVKSMRLILPLFAPGANIVPPIA